MSDIDHHARADETRTAKHALVDALRASTAQQAAHTRLPEENRGELDIRNITEDDGELIRELTLDPTRDYQPQADKV